MMQREHLLKHADKIDYTSQLTDSQQVFLKNYVLTYGNITQACNLSGITTSTYYNWLKAQPIFAYMMETEYAQEIMDNRRLDYVESKLMKRIEAGDTKAIVFFLRTKGRERGWTEKPDEKKKLDEGTKPNWFDEARPINTEGFQEAEVVETPRIEPPPPPEKPVPEKTKQHGHINPNRRRPNLSTQKLLELREGKNKGGNEQSGTGGNRTADSGIGTDGAQTNDGTATPELNGD